MADITAARILWIVDQAWNHGNVDALDEILAPEYIQHQPPRPDIVGLAAFKQHILGTRAAYPDWHLTLDGLIFDDNSAGGHGTWSLTTTTPGSAGKPVKCAFCFFSRRVNGKTMEEWSLNDFLGLEQQAGRLPS